MFRHNLQTKQVVTFLRMPNFMQTKGRHIGLGTEALSLRLLGTSNTVSQMQQSGTAITTDIWQTAKLCIAQKPSNALAVLTCQ